VSERHRHEPADSAVGEQRRAGGQLEGHLPAKPRQRQAGQRDPCPVALAQLLDEHIDHEQAKEGRVDPTQTTIGLKIRLERMHGQRDGRSCNQNGPCVSRPAAPFAGDAQADERKHVPEQVIGRPVNEVARQQRGPARIAPLVLTQSAGAGDEPKGNRKQRHRDRDEQDAVLPRPEAEGEEGAAVSGSVHRPACSSPAAAPSHAAAG
jgi:hypothetical protein